MQQLYEPKVWLEQGIARVGAHIKKGLDRDNGTV
jgi:hypothetical protein